ncbi:MAG: pyruvate dehydrogenase complex dihydrolipoamide acetyltransferase [Rhodobacter sp.]|nr:pyruvate dehydrogenase complex dihydrolipoamide acetyltransferase [Rhodobacter sp.]MCY4168062.1 pyruvate dehydrogenase complex dihydrolipoamide acetyltransferase [Rhodobacter sp.]
MPVEILMPALSPTMEEGTLAKWLVKEGDQVSSGDLLAEVETDKATMEFEAADDGVITSILVAEGTEGVKVNTPIAVLLGEGEDSNAVAARPSLPAAATDPEPVSTAPSAPSAPKRAVTREAAGESRVFASPLARRMAREMSLDLARIKGSGPKGRIVKADVEAAAAEPALAPQSTPSVPAAPPLSEPSFDSVLKMYDGRDFEEIALDGMRKTIAARLSEAKRTIPHFYLRREIRLDKLLDLRARINRQLETRGIKLSINDFIIKASAQALQRVPAANAVWAGGRILQLKPSDVAVAVAVDGGLFTPVLRDAHLKPLSELSTEMKDLASRARERRLAPHEYQGGSFSISNLGMYGIESFDAVINPPHGSILAVGAGIRKPVLAEDGQPASATIMNATLSVDHRVIDGALGAEFLQAIKDSLENPLTMLV